MISRIARVLLPCIFGMVYQAKRLSPPPLAELADDAIVISPRIRLSDGRYLAYREMGVPKDKAVYKVIIVHGFGSSKEMNFLAPQVHT